MAWERSGLLERVFYADLAEQVDTVPIGGDAQLFLEHLHVQFGKLAACDVVLHEIGFWEKQATRVRRDHPWWNVVRIEKGRGLDTIFFVADGFDPLPHLLGGPIVKWFAFQILEPPLSHCFFEDVRKLLKTAIDRDVEWSSVVKIS